MPFERLQKPQERSAAGPIITAHSINAATSVSSGCSMLRLNDHHRLLIIAVPRFSQNIPEITHYEIDQPLRGVPFKCPCGHAANRKCRNIMNGNLYPLIGHYQSSLSSLIRNHSRMPRTIIVATPQPTIGKTQRKSKISIIIYLQISLFFYHLSKRNSQIRNVKPQIKRPSRARTRTARIIKGKFIKIHTTPQRSAIARTRLMITFMASIIRLLLSYFLSILYHKNIFMSNYWGSEKILFLIL